jgi:hypothetical protein
LKQLAVKQEQLERLRAETVRYQQHDDSQVQGVIGHSLDADQMHARALEADATTLEAAMQAVSLDEKEKDRSAELVLEVETETVAKPSGDTPVAKPNPTPVIRSEAAAPEIGKRGEVIIDITGNDTWCRRCEHVEAVCP